MYRTAVVMYVFEVQDEVLRGLENGRNLGETVGPAGRRAARGREAGMDRRIAELYVRRRDDLLFGVLGVRHRLGLGGRGGGGRRRRRRDQRGGRLVIIAIFELRRGIEDLLAGQLHLMTVFVEERKRGSHPDRVAARVGAPPPLAQP